MRKFDSSGSTISRLMTRRQRWQVMGLVALTAILAVGSMKRGGNLNAAAAQSSGGTARAGKLLPGTASVSGTVTASEPFKAAQVYFRNPEKRMTYMVFTGAGQFRAVDIFPGDYEVSARWKGLVADMQKVTLKAGEAPAMTLALHDAAPGNYITRMYGGPDNNVKIQPYDEVYPPGPGRDVAERTCITCHGENLLPGAPGSADYWHARIDINMMGKDLWDRPSSAYQEGALNFRATALRMSRQDHDDLMAYVVKNFGPNAVPRAVKTVKEAPLDEAELAKAEFIEYTVIPDPPGKGAKAPEYVQIGYKGRRVIQDVRFDASGNVWGTDRGYPCRIVKLDPRTGEMTDYAMPEPTAEIHDMIVSRDGIVWLPQHGGAIPFGPQRIWGFNPKTEKFDYAIDMDPENFIRMPIKWMQSLAEDSQGNIIAGWFMGGALSMWHKKENKVTVHPIPMSNSMIYGVTIDKNDNALAAEYDGKIEVFHSKTATANGYGTWTEYTPPHYPGQIRRTNTDFQGHIIYGNWAGGSKIPGSIGVIDEQTSEFTVFNIPEQAGQPYDVQPDPDGNHIWFADSPMPDRAAQIANVNTKDGKFTFYPKPQFGADTPKIQVTRDGAVWYAPRGSANYPSVSVLYPDKDKITELGAHYVNGPPGYPFKNPADVGQSSTGKGR